MNGKREYFKNGHFIFFLNEEVRMKNGTYCVLACLKQDKIIRLNFFICALKISRRSHRNKCNSSYLMKGDGNSVDWNWKEAFYCKALHSL